MHLLQAQPGTMDTSEAVDLGQTPGRIVILSAADTDLAVLSAARAELGSDYPTLRLANLLHLSHPMSVDLFVESVVQHAELVLVRLLGGLAYWPYGVEQIRAAANQHGTHVVFVPGDDQPDVELMSTSTLESDAVHRIWQYFVHGGPGNAVQLLCYAQNLVDEDHHTPWLEPTPLPRAGIYSPAPQDGTLSALRDEWLPDAPVAAIVFYRAHVQAGNLRAIDALIAALKTAGLNPLPLYCASLKDSVCADTLAGLLVESDARIVLNTTGFAVSRPGDLRTTTPFDEIAAPVLQVVLSSGTLDAWETTPAGLSARDIAMNVALPEVDGRILSRAISFKGEAGFDEATECAIVQYEPRQDRVDFVASLAARWVALRNTPRDQRKVAIVLANYPNRDGRLGNGVGLDTPAGTVQVLLALRSAGYRVDEVPADGNALIDALLQGPSNASVDERTVTAWMPRQVYETYLQSLPRSVQRSIHERWGEPQRDPFYVAAEDAFAIAVIRYGNVVVGIQPARGYNIDPQATYHDPDLVPPHGYLGFYLWLRDAFGAQAIVHMGKHGNLEWLPGRSVSLGPDCYPEAALGPMPHIYPFIVNDPGEGTQAKRRSQAVIIDHLTPPLTRAESYGPLRDLEALVDEYYEASGVDPRRLAILRTQILDLIGTLGLDEDCGIRESDGEGEALQKLDGYLCELKEHQIRDGLHIFGVSPTDTALNDLTVALARLPRNDGAGANQSLIRALARDLGLPSEFDPLDVEMAEPWTGPRPTELANLVGLTQPDALANPAAKPLWRTNGDTVERLELLASALVAGETPCLPSWPNTESVLDWINATLRPNISACGEHELGGVLTGLDGRFVEPGPSGAPSRGRPEVLPTGRNFYSVDTRTVPTPAAWQLGWKSATMLLDRHRQEQGAWPKRLALSAWGTSNMRTGGDDISQALALMGVRPTWDNASRRVTGFEVLPASVLDRPRVDVTLRISGFFRDAFPALIDLFDSACRAVAALDEDARTNPLAARVREESAALRQQGHPDEEADRRASFRVFGSKPGAYGAGLQALIDEKGWSEPADLARAYVTWGGYAYGAGAEGAAEHSMFESRLGGVDAVVHNQDNREHDLLDSDDYYQFEGGMAVAVQHLSGTQPIVYHNDHSRPESPRIRRLEEEIGRVVRARVVNPKWIQGVMRHGYKGAFEMAATVDYLFAFSATTGAVRNHHFEAVYDAYLNDPDVLEFLQQNNPAALREMADRMREAIERGLWQARSNSAATHLTALASPIERGAAAESERT